MGYCSQKRSCCFLAALEKCCSIRDPRASGAGVGAAIRSSRSGDRGGSQQISRTKRESKEVGSREAKKQEITEARNKISLQVFFLLKTT